MNFVEGGVEAQARQALTNLKAVLEASGSEMGKVAKVTVRLRLRATMRYISDMYTGVHEGYE